MSYVIKGTVKLVDDVQEFKSGFTKREFVITTDDQKYPQDVKFECVKDHCAKLDEVHAGDAVDVTFDIRGNEYKGNHYVNLVAWRVHVDAAAEPTPEPVAEEPTPLADRQPGEETGSSDDEMPF